MANRPSRIVIPVYTPSYDGRYWGRYPDGDKPVSGAALEAGAAGQVAAAGALTTAIRLTGGAASVATSISGLSSGIRLSAVAADVAGASGALASSGSPAFTFDSGWTGSVPSADGQEFNVTFASGGLDFVSDARALLYIPADVNFLRNATYSRTTQTMTAAANASHQTSVKPANAVGAIRQLMPLPGASPAHFFFGNAPVWSFVGPQSYVFMKRYVTVSMGAGDMNNKIIRWWGAAGADGGLPDTYFSERSTAQVAVTEGIDVVAQADGTSRFHDMNYFPANEWTSDEHFLHDSDVDAVNGVINFARNSYWAFSQSKRYMTRSNNPAITQGGADMSEARSTGYLNQMSTQNGVEDGHSMYAHSIWISDSWARVMISTESNWNTAVMKNGVSTPHRREIQLTRSGSSTSVIGDLRLGELTSLSGKYLWAINRSGTARRIGAWS